MAERLIREGKAYVDDTPPDQMKADREACVKSPCRDNREYDDVMVAAISIVYDVISLYTCSDREEPVAVGGDEGGVRGGPALLPACHH